MNKLTKALLALGAAATMAVSAHSVLAETYVNETFETAGAYKNTMSVTRGGNAVWREVENPNGSGKVLEYDLTANGGIVNGDLVNSLLKDGAAITKGRVSLSTDIYIPKTLTNDDNITITANKGDGSGATAVIIANAGTTNGAKAAFTNYPVGEWFTVKWTIDYDKKCGTVNVITKDGEYTVMNSYRASVATGGLNHFRIGGACASSEAIKVYFDNVKFYDDPVELCPTTEKVWFNANPEATGVGTMAAGLVAKGGASGGSNVTDDYCEAVGKKALYVNAPGVYHLDNCITSTVPYQHFTSRTSGIQYLDFDMYIPADGFTAASAANFQVRNFGKAVRGAVKLTAADSAEAVSTALHPGAVARAVIGEEFTLRFVWNYASRLATAFIVKKDGSRHYVGQMAINETDTFKVDGFRITNSGCKYYITGIKYYDGANMPNLIDFESGAYTNDGLITMEGMIVPTVTGTNGSHWSMVTDTVPGSDNMAIKVTSKAGSNPDADAAVKFESYLLAMNPGNDVVTASIDLFMPEALAETEIITYQPLTSNAGKIPGMASGLASGEKWEQIVGNPVLLKGEYIGVGADGEFSVKYPVGEWFTLAVVYDTINSKKSEYIIKADGTVVEIAKASANMSRVLEYGIKAQRVHFAKVAGTVTEADKSFYVDNMKISALNINDSYLEYNDRDECYEGVVNYSAKGDVTMPSQIVMAGFDGDGNYVDCVIFNNTKFFNGNNSYMADIPVDDEGKIADVKMMYIDNMNSLKPLLPVAIAE